MPGPTPSTSTSITKTELPKWVNDAGKANYQLAKDTPVAQVYGGKTVADMSPTTTQAFDFFKDNLKAGATDTAAATSVFERMANPNSLSKEIGGYLNPYINNVEKKSLAALDDSRQTALMGNAANAVGAGAFGGSRSAVVDAITNAESIKDAGLLSAQLRSQGYSDAVNNRRSDLTTAGQGLLATGDQKQAQMLKQFAGLQSIGGAEQTQQQKILDSKKAKFDQGQQRPLEKLNMRLAALGMTPYSSSSSTNTTGTPGSPGFDMGAGVTGLLSLLAGFL